jgi:hypothetical protein
MMSAKKQFIFVLDEVNQEELQKALKKILKYKKICELIK